MRWQGSRKLRRPTAAVTIHLAFQPFGPQPDPGAVTLPLSYGLSIHRQRFLTVPDQPLTLTRTKGASAPEHENRFQNAGFSGPVRTKDVVKAVPELELGRFDAAEVPDP
jgi:hypothetical protein